MGFEWLRLATTGSLRQTKTAIATIARQALRLAIGLKQRDKGLEELRGSGTRDDE